MISQRQAKQYAYSLVAEGKYCFNQLIDIERSKLTAFIIQKTPEIYSYECISEADYKNEVPYLLAKYMETGDQDLGKDLLELMKKNAENYLSKQIDELLADQESEYKFDRQADGA